MKRENRTLHSYIAVFISSLSAILLTWYLTPYTGKTTLYLFFVLIVTINAWLGGFNLALFTTFIISVIAGYFFLFPYQFFSNNPLISLYEITVFTIIAIILTHIIERYRRTDLINDFFEQETAYKKRIHHLQLENTKMQQEIKLREEFLSIASHELKTPLTSMLLKLQMVLHNIRNVSLANFSVENLLKMLETAEQQTQRLARLINDLLNVSLITTGKWNLELGNTDLVAIVKEVVDEFSEKMQKKGYLLHLEMDDKVEIQADKLRIEQVITNLLSNAIKYGSGKPIDVKVAKTNDHAKIVVKDHGIGIENGRKEKIFGLFERGVTSADYKGLGVGLYIAHQIIKAHHGSITVDSKLNGGSTFTVEIPITQTK